MGDNTIHPHNFLILWNSIIFSDVHSRVTVVEEVLEPKTSFCIRLDCIQDSIILFDVISLSMVDIDRVNLTRKISSSRHNCLNWLADWVA